MEAASVFAVVDLSVKIASFCFQYCKDVKYAKHDIDRLIREVNNLKDTSAHVTEFLDGPNGTRLKSSQKLRGAVKDSLRELRKIIQKLDPRVGRKAMSRVGIRAKFSSKDVEKTIQDLARCTQSMSMALHID